MKCHLKWKRFILGKCVGSGRNASSIITTPRDEAVRANNDESLKKNV